MNRNLSLPARLALTAALVLPALAFAPRAAHAFSLAEAAMLVPLACLALGLTWRAPGSPRAPGWAWAGLLLLTAVYALTLVSADHPNWLPRLKLQDEAWSLGRWRASLGLGALTLAWWAWARRRHAELGAVASLGLALGAWACLAGAFGPRPDISWRSVLEQSSYLALFAAVWAQVRADPSLARRLVWAAMAVGLLNTAYGLVQAAGLDPLPWNQGFGGRAGGFFGNPDLLGGHLALLLPLAFSLALDDAGSLRARLGRWAVALGLALGLLATQTRGAWLGAATGLSVVLGWAWLRRREALQRQRRALLLVLGLALLSVGAWVAAHPQLWQRLSDVAQGQDAEVSRRLFLMKKSAQLAMKHPLLGQGPGAYRISFASVEVVGLDPATYASQPFVISEHGHDDLLQWAADAGWPAAMLWVALLAALFLALWRRLSAAAAEPGQGDAWLLLGVIGGLVALQVHGLGNYPYLMLPTQGLAWGLAALGLALGQAPMAVGVPPPPEAPRPSARQAWWVLAVAAALFVWSGQRMAQDHLWWMAEGELRMHQPDTASNLLVRTLSFDRREDRLWVLHGRSEAERGFIWNSIGSLREAVRLSPYDAEAGVRLGRACVENRVFDEAEAVLSKVAGYAPNFVDVWEPLAAAYYNQGKFAEAVQAYDWMLYFHVNDESAYANKAAALGSMGKLPQALVTLHNAQLALPGSGKIKVNLAITYLKLGMRKEAKAAWKEAAALAPSDPQVDQLRGILH